MSASREFSISLRKGRVHEACGAGAAAFALMMAAQMAGPVIWVREGWQHEQVNPLGLQMFLNPERLLMAAPANHVDTLAVAEDALRDGAAPFVILSLTQALTLTTGRRLQLAAELGRSTGVCLIPEGMGSNAAETRWRCQPVFHPDFRDGQPKEDSTVFSCDLIKNKAGTLGVWHVRWHAQAHRLHLVSAPAERQGVAATPA